MEKPVAPVFVKIHNYKEVLDIMDVLKHKLSESQELLSKLHDLKTEEDAALEASAKDLDDVGRKLSYMDKTLFKPEL